MSTASISFRVPEELKRDMDELCRKLGISISAAFTILARSAVENQGLPSVSVKPAESKTSPTFNIEGHDDKDK